MKHNTKKIVTLSSLSVFFLIIVAYALFVSRNLIFGVDIKNVSIENGTTTTESVLKVTGNAKHAIKLTLNGREISIDQQGNFDETIALLLGYNTIEIWAKDKFGLTDIKNYQVIHKQSI